MILESIVTTINDDDSTNISPMGPIIDESQSKNSLRGFQLRPFQTSTTYRNLKRDRAGIMHVTDNVLHFAQAAVGTISPEPELIDAVCVRGRIIKDACRWYAFKAVEIDDSNDRTEIRCEIVDQGTQRDFFGFNRAKHAVLEAAILATRLHLLSEEHIHTEFERLQIPIEKTAGPQERKAFQFLRDFVESKQTGSKAR